MEKNKLPEIQISELFLVKCGNDWTRTFMATIRREIDDDGNHVVYGSIIVEEGEIWCMASNEGQLGSNLDDICKMKLDMQLHSHAGMHIKIHSFDFFLN
jgi:hypothetical protein